MSELDITNVNISSEYNKDHDTWYVKAKNNHLNGVIELKYKAVLYASKEIFRVIEQVQPKLGSFLELEIDYHKGRSETFYLDFNRDKGIISKELLDESSKPELKVTVFWEHFIQLVSGDKEPQTMFMNGQLKMTGNLVKAMKIQSVIGETITNLKASL